MEKTISFISSLVSVLCIAFSVGIYISIKEADTTKLKEDIISINNKVIDFQTQYLELPVGSIVSWNPILESPEGKQTYRNLPEGWSICNGLNGTPDLSDKFLRGVVKLQETGSTGGNNEGLKAGSHKHRYGISKGGGNGSPHGFQAHGPNCETANHDTHSSGVHSHGDNRPAFYSVIYIMKLK